MGESCEWGSIDCIDLTSLTVTLCCWCCSPGNYYSGCAVTCRPTTFAKVSHFPAIRALLGIQRRLVSMLLDRVPFIRRLSDLRHCFPRAPRICPRCGHAVLGALYAVEFQGHRKWLLQPAQTNSSIAEPPVPAVSSSICWNSKHLVSHRPKMSDAVRTLQWRLQHRRH